MAINEEARQVEIANELYEAATTLAHSTRTVPSPANSYRLLGELTSTLDSLEQVCRQLSQWHNSAQDGNEYAGQDTDEFGNAADAAGAQLASAAESLATAVHAVGRAHTANGVIRWINQPQQDPTASINEG